MVKRLYEFVTTAGLLGVGSVLVSIVCIGITITERVRGHDLSASIFVALAVVFSYVGAFLAWSKERDARLEIERRYLDGHPQIGLEIYGLQGPTAWRDAITRDACVLVMRQLSGRPATSFRFDEIASKLEKFNLTFDALPFIEQSPCGTGLTHHVQRVGDAQLSAHDMEQIGDIEGKMLGMFLDDSPQESLELRYTLTVRFKDRDGEELSHHFNIVFDKTRYMFLSNTEQPGIA